MKKNNIIKLSLAAILSLQIGVFADTNTLNSVNVVAEDSYNVKSMSTSTGLNLALKDTPQVISVITTQELEDRGLDNLEDLFNHITGISINRFDERIDPKARGFSLDYYKIDGVPYKLFFNSRTFDLSLYDRVEIVKGANGLTTGAGSPGVSINFIRKRANSKELKGSFGLEVDSEGSYILNSDVSSGLNSDGSIRGRFVAKHENSNLYLDKYETEKNIVMGIVDVDFGDTTTLSTGLSYEKVEKSGVRWGGLPAHYTNGSKTNYDVSTNLTDDWTYNDTETVSVFTKLNHYFSNDLLLSASYNFEKTKRQGSWMYFAGYQDTGLTPYSYISDIENKRHEFDIKLNIPYDFNNMTSELVFGYTYNIDKVTKNREGGHTLNIKGGSFGNYDVSILGTTVSSGPLSKIEQNALYLVNNLDITEELKFLLGGRFTDYSSTNESTAVEDQDFNEFTPYAGLVYDITNETSIYASYTNIFAPQTFKDSNGNYLDPVVGNSYEVGVKGEYFDKALTTTLGFFRTKQDNAGELAGGQLSNGDFIYKAVDGVVSKGVELEISGKVTNDTTLSFNLTHFNAEDQNGDKFNTIASRTTASLFAKYNYNDFTFGGGVDYKSKTHVDNKASSGALIDKTTQDAYYLVNLMGAYKINKNLSAQLNISNLFDKKYYDAMTDDDKVLYGAPRTFTAKLTYTF